jgi:Cdc25 family phosphatase
VESSKFYDDAVLDQVIDGHCAKASTIVVHCMLSQVRGPKSARLLAARLEDHRDAGSAAGPTVVVLRGGFQRFCQMYQSDPELVQDLDSAIWG